MKVGTRAIIDEGILESYRMLQEAGQPDIVTEFIDVFLSDLPFRIDQLVSAVESTEPAAIRAAAHALKGSSASVGAIALSALCARLEAIGRSGSNEGADELLEQIELETERSTEELERHRKP